MDPESVISIAQRTLIVSGTRLLNRALIVISPIILARLLSVTDFGHYREWLLYVTMLVGLAAFGINSSLLSFIPSAPQHGWRYVNQAVLMTLGSSTLVAVGALLLNVAFGGSLLGAHPWAVVIYVWLFTNFDFWEPLLIAEKQAYRVWGYTTGRLLCRLTVVTVAAALTRDVSVIVWSLVGYETLRMLLSARAWHLRNRAAAIGSEAGGSWREQLRYCAPFGSALIVGQLNASMGSLFVTKMLGPAALAQFAIGAYAQPIITLLRNSLSDVLLGEMAARRLKGENDLLSLWRRSTVVTAILLVPLGILLARFADTIVVTLFSPSYQPAVIVFQLYVLALLRETFDFGIPLRALNRTAPILRTNVLAVVANVGLMAIMVPAWGLVGAAIAFVISKMVEGTYLATEVVRAFNLRPRDLARWGDLAKIVAAAAAAAGAVLFLPLWSGMLGALGG
ncbi:MAG TPA: oligosaccharide flippase family protein, partial [Steroidobacteraceae bacterium]|nr:oligosaccharide flippase family protein [Steroidobacteraceae bacterium]